MNIQAYLTYGAVKAFRPLRWLTAQFIVLKKGGMHFIKHNMFKTFLGMVMCGLTIFYMVTFKKLQLKGVDTIFWSMGVIGLLAFLFGICFIALNAKKSHGHIQKEWMQKQDSLELRFALDKAISNTSRKSSKQRL